jgi:ABC-type branched-subunit amino acid transport system substrate-binding protein
VGEAGVRRLAALATAIALVSACSVERLDDGDGVTAAGTFFDATTTTIGGERVDGVDAGAPTTSTVPGAPALPGAPAASVPGAPGRAPTANIAGGEGEPRRASDRGVGEDEIVLGILGTDEGFFAATGSSTARHEDVFTPFVREINDAGGINGRKVVVKVTRYDPLSADSMQAACVEQAEDHKVFASIAQVGFYGDAEVCMASKETPLLTGNNSSAHTNVERERGWVRQTQMNKDRNIKTWIDWMIGVGLLTPETRTGALYVDVPEDRQLVEQVVIPYLESKGMQRPEPALLSASIAQTPAEAQSAVLKFRGEGVQLVLPFVSFLRMLVFAQQADVARYTPAYSVSDFGLLSSDAMAGMPPSQWEGVTGITALRTGVDPPGSEPSSPQYRECKDVYVRYGGDIDVEADPLELASMMHYCQHLALWADAARRAGVNPTRQSFLGALASTGTWTHRVVLTERLTFTPTKYDGADLVAVVRWQSSCTSDGGCYRQVEGFRQGAH